MHPTNFSFPEFGIIAEVTETEITVIDESTQNLLAKHNLPSPAARAWLDKGQNIKFESKKFEGETYTIYIGLLYEASTLKTKGEYIMDFIRDTTSHGFYFGLYEIGEFCINHQQKLELLHSFEIQYISLGRLIPDSYDFLLSLRETDPETNAHTYFCVRLHWQSPTPSVVWKKTIPISLKGLIFQGNTAQLGFHSGKLEQWDIISGESLGQRQLFTSELFHLIQAQPHESGIVYAAGRSEEVLELVAITKSGEIEWKFTFEGGYIEALKQDGQGIHIINEKGIYHCIDPQSGTSLHSHDFKCDSSDLALFRDWIVVSKYGGWTSVYRKDWHSSFSHFINDPLLRKLVAYPFGVISGDDEGIIRYWQVGQVEIVKDSGSLSLGL
ncbi:MAG: hypothetical protein ACTSYI_04885 [Promethearchaeota archaeon]